MTETARTETARTETTGLELGRVRMLRVEHDDPRVQGLLDGLLGEYTERYGAEGAANELGRYPVTDFVAPLGRLVLAESNGEIVAGGALRPYRPAPTERRARSSSNGSGPPRDTAARVWAGSS